MAKFFDPELSTKPDFVECIRRIYAWYDHQVLDRVPVRFSAHNADFEIEGEGGKWADLKTRWYDAEYQVNKYLRTVEQSSFLGETFPIYWPNLGPNVFAGMLGAGLTFGDVTSWVHPLLNEPEEIDRIAFNRNSEYLLKINALTDLAIEVGKGKFLTGYTDMHPGFDCADALLGTESLFYHVVDNPEFIMDITRRCEEAFFPIMDAFHEKLEATHQLSASWMQIPTYEPMHIPSCDLGSMVSVPMFNEFALPHIKNEAKHFPYNIFHVDGKGVANHLDTLLEIPEIQAYQWVQGVGVDRPIMQWVPLIQRIQSAGKSAVVDLLPDELDSFMEVVRPEGILLCIDEPTKEGQQAIINKLLRWS